MNISLAPYNWNSLHRPIVYEYDYVTKTTNSISNNGGFARFNFASAFTITPVVGERFIVEDISSIYKGIHVIKTVDSTTQFTTESTYIGGAGAVLTKHVRLPEIRLYKGYLSGEPYYATDPAVLVATFRPRNSINNNIRIDVSGYLQSVFAIEPPVAGVDNNMFSRFRLYFDGAYQPYYHVLNSALESSDLDANYANTGRYLVNRVTPYLLSCGDTLISRIEGDAVINYELAGALEGDEFDTDFDTDFSTE